MEMQNMEKDPKKLSRKMAALGIISAAVTYTPALAQASQSTSAPVDRMVACRGVVADVARLQCFDAAAAALAQARLSGALVVVDRAEVRKTRRSLFGFNAASLPFFRGDNSQDDEPKDIAAKIKSVRAQGYNKWLFELEDGAMWQTTEADAKGFAPKPGTILKIKKGSLGGYMLQFEGARPLRGMRVK
jgi:hypothetical protein